MNFETHATSLKNLPGVGIHFLVTIPLVLFFSQANAQYFQFSQYNFTSQRINPAITGITKYASADVDFRTQKTGGDFNINSNFFAAAYPLLNRSTGEPWSGVGISVMDDHSSGIYKKQEAALSYAIHIKLSRYQQLSLGFKALYQTEQINLDGFTTGAQYIPDRGFDTGLSSGETFQTGKTHYTTFSTGVYWQETNKTGDIVAHWGVTIFDMNKPSYSFLGNPMPVPASLVFLAGFEAYRSNGNSILPEVLYTRSSATNVLNAGARFRHELRSSPNQPADKVDLIAKYVIGRSGIIGIQFHRENISFGVSYDFPVLTANPANLGAIEVGLTIRKLVETKNKKRARQRELDRQKLAARRKKAPAEKPVTKDSTLLTTPIPEIQIVKTDTSKKERAAAVSGHARVGDITQDPLVVEKIILHFHFDYNSVDLDDETETYLRKLEETLTKDPTLKLKITGHTDNIGPAKFNLRLSQKRADAIRDFLIQGGIESTRLEATGKGLSEPLNENDTEQQQALNRRVEIVVYKD